MLCCVLAQCCVSVPSCVYLSCCVLRCVVQCSACATCRQLLTSVCPRGRTQARQQPPKSCPIFRPNQSDFLKKKYSPNWANLRLYPRTDYPQKWTSAPVPSSSITRLLSLWKCNPVSISLVFCSCSYWLCENSFAPFSSFFKILLWFDFLLGWNSVLLLNSYLVETTLVPDFLYFCFVFALFQPQNLVKCTF